MGVGTGGVGVDEITLEGLGPAFGHLAATGVARTKEEDAKFVCGGHGSGSFGAFAGCGCAAGAGAAAVGAVVGRVGDAGVDGVGHCAERGGEIDVANGVVNGLGALLAGEHACTREDGEVARDDGEVDGAAVRDFTDRAGTGALCEAGEEGETGGIAQCAEEIGGERTVYGAADASSVARGTRRTSGRFHLHGCASIQIKQTQSKRRLKRVVRVGRCGSCGIFRL